MIDKGKRPLALARRLRLQKRFLTAYAQGFPTVKSAAKKAKLGTTSHYRWMDTDEKYAQTFKRLRDERVEEFEAEAARRAVTGISVPKTVAGERVDVKEYSDALLMFILKAERPEKYKDRVDTTIHATVDWGELVRLSMEGE